MDDDYALQQELEALAGNAFADDSGNDTSQPEPIATTMSRWQRLFGISADEAIERIMEHRNNLTRGRVSEEHWDLLRTEKEAAGYDREAYEYELELQKKKAILPNMVPTTESHEDSLITYLVELNGPLDTAQKVQAAASLDWTPPVVNGHSTEDGRAVTLCCVNSAGKKAILQWGSAEGAGFEPTILVDPRSLR